MRSTVVVIGAVFALLIVGMALFAGGLAPYPPDEQNFDLIEAKPGAKALFGTDRFGRDVLSRVIYGARVSLYVAVTSIGLAMLVGGALGLTAGYAGGVWDNAINRVMDVFFSIPGLLLAVGVAAMRGPGVNSAVVAITIVYTPLFARVMRGPVLAEREKEYIEAVRALGASWPVVALKPLIERGGTDGADRDVGVDNRSVGLEDPVDAGALEPLPLDRRAIEAQHPNDVFASLRIRRNPAVRRHRLFASVVGRDRERQVGAEPHHHGAQVTRTRVDVLACVERIAHPENRRGLWHQLHESAGPRSRHRAMIESGFGDDDRANQARRHRISRRSLGDLTLVSVAFRDGSPR